jgi:hypothetical protein
MVAKEIHLPYAEIEVKQARWYGHSEKRKGSRGQIQKLDKRPGRAHNQYGQQHLQVGIGFHEVLIRRT